MHPDESPIQHPNSDVQAVQAEYRKRLVSAWNLPPDSKVLEIGCGQGDTTVALLEYLGAEGHVTAIDAASPTYGTPLTLGQAVRRIERSILGSRVEFRLGFDPLEAPGTFGEGSFDAVVLSHSSWYFESESKLLETLRVAKRWAHRLCFAEWNYEPRSPDQVLHALAAGIQAQIAVFDPGSQPNVRTLLTRRQARSLIQRAGWSPGRSRTVCTDGLQDADWEITACLEWAKRDPILPNIPEVAAKSLENQLALLRSLARPSGNRTLDAFSLSAS